MTELQRPREADIPQQSIRQRNTVCRRWRLLNQYHVQYVYVGPNERRLYEAEIRCKKILIACCRLPFQQRAGGLGDLSSALGCDLRDEKADWLLSSNLNKPGHRSSEAERLDDRKRWLYAGLC